MKIIRIPVEEWERFRDLRLEMVTKHPAAFSGTPEEIKNSSEDKLKNYLKESLKENGTSRTLFAVQDDELIGVVAGYHTNNLRDKHIGNIVSFYVKEKFRGQGIGKNLLSAIEDWLKNKQFIKKLKLSAYKENPAVNLYKKYGYKKVGDLKKELFADGKYYDEVIMEKIL